MTRKQQKAASLGTMTLNCSLQETTSFRLSNTKVVGQGSEELDSHSTVCVNQAYGTDRITFM